LTSLSVIGYSITYYKKKVKFDVPKCDRIL
jgi:hypothetical protein